MRHPSLVWLAIAAIAVVGFVMAGCTRSTASGEPPSEVPSASAVRTSPLPSAPASSAPPIATSACAPWGARGFSVKARRVAGHAAFFRELDYDDGSGALAVHDSDPYASGTGKEEAKPRVIKRSIKLSPADHEAVARDLIQICPDEAARAARCAPGGCFRFEVRAKSGADSAISAISIEDHVTAGKVIERLSSFFPELRKG